MRCCGCTLVVRAQREVFPRNVPFELRRGRICHASSCWVDWSGKLFWQGDVRLDTRKCVDARHDQPGSNLFTGIWAHSLSRSRPWRPIYPHDERKRRSQFCSFDLCHRL